ncbi:MAG: hypothetical protein IKQ10_09435 [Oscillospiraceae bacterium]|nr:hypothetical protein [Oscillospiraceae bacterium]
MQRKILSEWGRIVVGLLIFSFGVHLTIRAELGLAPWDCLGMGISYHTPLNYGLAMTVLAVSILGIDLLLRERIGFGTVIDALLTGNMVQMFNTLDRLPKTRSLWAGILIILAGLTFMALGQVVYMRAGQCCGPRDSLLVGLGKRLRKLPIGLVQIILWAAVLLIGRLLGGPVGIGTVVSTFGAGAVMQLVCSALRFEPRDVAHRDIPAVMAELRSGSRH